MKKKGLPGPLFAILVGLFFLIALGVVIPMLLPTSCVVEGTLVSTPSGRRSVESLSVGDEIWCRAPDSTLHVGTVDRTVVGTSSAHLRLAFSGGAVLRVTRDHPVATAEGWVRAGLLKVGDSVAGFEGGSIVLKKRETVKEAVIVYDLSISPHPNFFASGILVHNKTSPERWASSSLKTIASAQAWFRSNDPDGNEANDFWVGDVAELYFMEGPDGELLKLIERSVALKDAAPLHPPAEEPGWPGYRFAVIPERADGTPYAGAEHRSFDAFAVCAFPIDDRLRHAPTFILNEGNTIYTKDLGLGRRVLRWPANLEAEGWVKMD